MMPEMSPSFRALTPRLLMFLFVVACPKDGRDASILVDKLPRERYREPQPLVVDGGRMPLLSEPVPAAFPQTPSSALKLKLQQLSPNTAVGSCNSDIGRDHPGSANLADNGAENAYASTDRGEVESCTTGAATGLVCDLPPTPVKVSGFGSSQPVPGQLQMPSSEAVAAAQVLEQQKDTEDKPPTIGNTVVDPPEKKNRSKDGIGNDSGTANRPGVTASHCNLPAESPSQTTPLPPNEKEDREQVPQTSPKASMDHLRRAALAAVSSSAAEDASIVGSNDVDQGQDQVIENGRSSASVEIKQPYPSSSPAESPCPSSPSPSPPRRFLPGKGVGVPENCAANVPPNAAGPTQDETKPSTLKPAGDELSPDARGSVPGAGETSGSVILPIRTTVPPRIALETAAQRESNSSFSVDDKGPGEEPVRTKQSWGRVDSEPPRHLS